MWALFLPLHCAKKLQWAPFMENCSNSSSVSDLSKSSSKMGKRLGNFGARIGSYMGMMSDQFFDYDTPKMVQIKSKKVGLINRVVQICVIAYVVIYVLIINKDYQKRDNVEGSATAKLKGVAYTNITDAWDLQVDDPTPYNRIWDLADYVIPPQQTNAFFVMTNMVITPKQTRGICPEAPDVWYGRCKTDADCPAGEYIKTGNGMRTGSCVPTPWPYKDVNKTCEIKAWCPIENDKLPRAKVPVLLEAKNFTVMIKNSISFPAFNFSKRNIRETAEKAYLRGCMYDPVNDPLCPIFKLGSIVEMANDTFENMAYKGGVVTIDIQWNCNLDRHRDECLPKYRFFRSDDQHAQIAAGFNFRYSKYYKSNGSEHRTLTKAYGILFNIKITGVAGQFHFIPLMLNVASGFALLSLATVMCDIVVLYLLKKRNIYKECKYQNVNPVTDDGYEVPALRTFSKADGNSAIFPLRRISYDGNSMDVGKRYATAYLDSSADNDRNS
ncbi:P2X purinoceptor 4-like isoform X2 [Acanthaster planci]|uniref:P2X purinoceptor 4-like isoform X2 n=1 Tax=Acanthaster planci TaxID=133434 RepID=A0A8B7ZS81_ACAPL|nr:P2X purinoceptor 4-like isoform X2 [Acanthaster planci]